MSGSDLEERFERYQRNLKNALGGLKVEGGRGLEGSVGEVVDLARRYSEDAVHFKGRGQLVDALIALAYAEGLLDAMRLLGVVHFSWSGG